MLFKRMTSEAVNSNFIEVTNMKICTLLTQYSPHLYMPHGNGCTCPPKGTQHNVHSSAVWNRSKLKTTQMANNCRLVG